MLSRASLSGPRGKAWTTAFFGTMLFFSSAAQAALLNFDFDSGVGPNFSIINTGNQFQLDLDGPNLRISKGSDSGAINPNGFLLGGVQSKFTFDGDFSVTIDFTLHEFPFPGASQLNESLLAVIPESGGLFEVLRFRVNHSLDLVEVFAAPTGGPLGVQGSSLLSGRYRIVRNGDTLTGLIAPAGGGPFVEVASYAGLSGPVRVQPFAAQGTDNPGFNRSTTALDISFDNLTIEADRFQGVVPEPVSVVVWLLLFVSASAVAWRSHTASSFRDSSAS